jgi:hypothetical protein
MLNIQKGQDTLKFLEMQADLNLKEVEYPDW